MDTTILQATPPPPPRYARRRGGSTPETALLWSGGAVVQADLQVQNPMHHKRHWHLLLLSLLPSEHSFRRPRTVICLGDAPFSNRIAPRRSRRQFSHPTLATNALCFTPRILLPRQARSHRLLKIFCLALSKPYARQHHQLVYVM